MTETNKTNKTNSRYYFAYGSNMDWAQMKWRCPGADIIGIAKLCGYQFIINTYGVATIVPKESSEVYGVLWLISEDNERKLDIYESIKRSIYMKMIVNVEMVDPYLYISRLSSQSFQALTYIANANTPGVPRDSYMEKIVAATERYCLPDKYIEELRSWLQTGN